MPYAHQYQTNPELAAVNYVLRRLGEQPVTGLDVPYPTVGIVRAALEEARHLLLSDEWYFNTFTDASLEFDVDSGTVPVPPGAIQVYPHDKGLVSTGKVIVDAASGIPVQTDVKVKLVLDVPLDRLPLQAVYVVQSAAALSTYVQDFGAGDSTAQVLQAEYLSVYHQLSGQHTRTRRSRVHDRAAMQRHIRKLRN